MSADIAVVGAGIVGLACARELQRRRPSARIVVLEREDDIARHQTGHNSGVIHAGIYYAPGSLKAQLCATGARAMYEFCDEHAIPVERCGKLIVALTDPELAGLDELERRGLANGVAGLERLSGEALREREPNVRGVAALWSPATGIVDFARVADALRQEFVAAGGELRLGVEAFDTANEARHVLTCAGAWADRVATRAGANPDPRIIPFRGTYLRVKPERADLVRALIYPVPDPALPFLGVHLTRTINGELLIGPTARLSAARGYGRPTAKDLRETVLWPGTWRVLRRHWRSSIREVQMAASRKTLVAAAAAYVPALTAAAIAPGGWHGVRAQAVARDGALVDDFVISETNHALHVRNAPSPAATSALAIAGHIADRFDAAFG